MSALRALSEADFVNFKSLELPPHLEQAQDLFLVSFYMRGMNYINITHLKIMDIEGEFERIRYQRNKTRKHFSIKISDPLKAILKKHIGNRDEKTAFVFPILNEDIEAEKEYDTIKNKRKRINKKFRKIALLAGIEPFTVYAARHTYATMGNVKGHLSCYTRKFRVSNRSYYPIIFKFF